MKKISLICPVYNEEENVNEFYRRMCVVIDNLPKYEFEFVYIDNCSTDKTFPLLLTIQEKDNRVKIYRLSRNFGFQNSIFTGYEKCSGDAAIEFDADLQDPPELLSLFLEKWELGYLTVYGVRKTRKDFFVVTLLRKLYYRVLNKISEVELPHDAGDFMLIDRKIIDLLKNTDERCLYLRGTIFSFGFPRIQISYDRDKRFAGKSKFSISKLASLALDGIVNSSSLPLQYLFYFGIFFCFLTILASLIYFWGKLTGRVDFPLGTASILISITISMSINSLFLGVLGIYISRIYIEVKKRPRSIIEKLIDSDMN